MPAFLVKKCVCFQPRWARLIFKSLTLEPATRLFNISLRQSKVKALETFKFVRPETLRPFGIRRIYRQKEK